MLDHTTLMAVISLFILLMVGYCLKKFNALKTDDLQVVNNLLIYMCMPSIIFTIIHNKPLTHDMIKSPFIILAIQLLLMTMAYFIGKLLKLDRKTHGSFIILFAFGNTGFLGYPLIMSIFPGDNIAIFSAVILDLITVSISIFTIGTAIAISFSGEKCRLSNFLDYLKSPLLYSVILGLVLRKVYIPDVILTSLGYMAAATIPLAMISIGMSLNLNLSSLKNYALPITIVVIFKMFVFATLAYLILPIFGVQGIVYKVAVMECAVPCGALCGVITSKYGCNNTFSAAAIFVTTILSVFVLPFVFCILG